MDTAKPETLPAVNGNEVEANGEQDAAAYHRNAITSLKDGSLFIKDAFIDGQWVQKEKTFPVYEPSTGTVLGDVANCTLEDFQTAIKSADIAQREFWATTTAAQRGGMLRRWFDLIMANQDDGK
ncbi:hypothetical protein LTS18_014046 [Coniosporium uncinatum]|uniref:Uncharacterized protein n=1 Tax=Coniosporium uncinatum TaxID=93489 RepID=A0ACC3D8W0_9PEZI|nr:hypothetical protein LTS18_014046 [Coniosporium uncinatum]